MFLNDILEITERAPSPTKRKAQEPTYLDRQFAKHLTEEITGLPVTTT